ncbi:putative nucleic acid-binding protein [Allocatelliglobosispora scoriae]|uniref:Ribonuclease VapC n=1 Tax=Allocatelliglobosispora scoriae TaxID=643052 RepID=A0A841C4P1_9ACTN|nr:type II toxin-antitoxin system VapC family toxin [Allocatelliglobosispora scoriae]MBB5873791.1 putative nucleic acid-binding protein [Allocatelliglobosispora scoriae]
MIYLDTSAAAKLVQHERESQALAVWLAARIGRPLVSSALIYPELIRAVTRHRPGLADRAIALSQRIMTVPIAADIVASSATVGNPGLRTLDAIHLATAVAIGAELEAFVTYDKRLAAAAAEIGLTVAAPA